MSALMEALLTGEPLPEATAAALAHYSREAHQAEHPQAWADLTPFQQRCVLHAMSRYGGGFVARLAEAWQCADEANSAILGAAFAHRLGSYWPGTVLHAEAALRELA